VREGHTGMQQTAAEGILFAPQIGLAFRMWLLMGRFACRNAGTAPHPPKYDPQSNNPTSSYA